MELPFVASVPRAKRAKPRSPFDLFDDDFFNDPFAAFGQMEKRSVTAPAVELDVQPLPAQNRPQDFTGAVGMFQLAVEGSPTKVKVGDPVTLRMRITGSGNFDRVGAPVLVDPNGWHAYDASADFKPASEEVITSGTKTFEMAVVPEQKKTQMPQVQFSYFDPDAERYVTLKSEPQPLTVEGGAPRAPAPAIAATPEPPQPAPEPPAATPATDIVGVKYDFGARRDSFEPVYRSRIFWIAQGVPLLALLAMIGVRIFRKDETSTRAAALRSERARLWKVLEDSDSDAEFFQHAARIVQIDTALATGAPDAGVDAAVARAALALDDETAAGIDEIFARRGELIFAGAARGDGRLSRDERRHHCDVLERFSKSHAKR
jgi:hypothetical protein